MQSDNLINDVSIGESILVYFSLQSTLESEFLSYINDNSENPKSIQTINMTLTNIIANIKYKYLPIHSIMRLSFE